MKYVKVILGVLVVATVACFTSVFANAQWYTFTLPSFNGEVEKGPQSKETTVAQQYKNIATSNNCTGNNNTISARVYSEAYGYSSWMAVSVGATSSWALNNKTTTIQAYKIYVKNNVWSPCTAYHGGTWYLDNY